MEDVMRRMLLSLLLLVAVSVPAMGDNLDGLAGTYSFTIGQLGPPVTNDPKGSPTAVDMLGVFELSGDGVIAGSRTYFVATGTVEQTFVGSYTFDPDGIGVANINVVPAFPPTSCPAGTVDPNETLYFVVMGGNQELRLYRYWKIVPDTQSGPLGGGVAQIEGHWRPGVAKNQDAVPCISARAWRLSRGR